MSTFLNKFTYQKVKGSTFCAPVILFIYLAVPKLLLASNHGGGGGGVDTFQFTNPLVTNSFQELLYALLRILMVIGIPIVIFFIIYAGFMYVMARGNTEQVQTATKALTYAIIGGLIVLGATVITGIVTSLVGSFIAD